MKLNRLFLVGALVAMALPMLASAAKADGLPPGDPIFKAGGDPDGAVVGIIVPNFIITSPSGDSPATSPCVVTQPAGSSDPIIQPSMSCLFINVVNLNGVGGTINALFFDLPGVDPASVNCSNTITGATIVFSPDCLVTGDGGDGTKVVFSGGTGIAFLSEFSIEMDGFNAGQGASGYANVPEPGTLPMLGLGLVGLLALTRKRIFQQAQ